MKFEDWLVRYVPQKILIFKFEKNQTPRSMQSYSNFHYLLHHHSIQDGWLPFFTSKQNILEGGKPLFCCKQKSEQKILTTGKGGGGGRVFSPFFEILFGKTKQTKTPEVHQHWQKQNHLLANSRQYSFCIDAAISKFRGCCPWEFRSGKLWLPPPSLGALDYYFNKPVSTVTSPYLLEKIKELRSA